MLVKNPHWLRAEKCLPLLFTSKFEQGPFCGKSCVVEVRNSRRDPVCTGSRREFGYQKFCFLAESLLRFLPGIKIQVAKISPGPQCDPTKIPALILQGDVITCTFMLSELIATTHTFINITSYYHLCPVSKVFQECTEYRLNLAAILL